MTIETTDTGASNNDAGNVADANSADVGLDLGGSTPESDVLEKHINIALEAQDGKAATESGTNADGTPKVGTEQTAAGSTSTGGTTNGNAQQQAAGTGQADQGNTRGPKDLILKGQGPDGTDLVIKAGLERRLYEQGRIAKDELHVTQQSARAVSTQLQEARAALQTMQETVQTVQGMSAQDMATAARLYNDLKRDPTTALRTLLAEAASKGLTVEGIGANLNVEAIRAAVKAELGATLQAQPQQQSQEQIIAEATREANAFFAQFPDARTHDPLIARVMHDHPGVDLHTAYFKLREQFAMRGLDWSRPLDEQLQQSSSNANGNAQQAPANANGNVVPMPGARPNPASATNAGATPVKHESTSMDDIIRESMREAGLQVRTQ